LAGWPDWVAPFWPSADDFRFTLINRHLPGRSACLKGANRRHGALRHPRFSFSFKSPSALPWLNLSMSARGERETEDRVRAAALVVS